ncbi:hypothetical protein PBAC_02570 [Pedobacter glucosidilyticus]|nr:hypothetical protein PBAC_02570 [Pedobacter glucosidilyticus]
MKWTIKRSLEIDNKQNICKMDHVLIDTDVILDFFFDREPFVKSAAEILPYVNKSR